MKKIEFSLRTTIAASVYHSEESWGLLCGLLFVSIWQPICKSKSLPKDLIDLWGFSWDQTNGVKDSFFEDLHLYWGEHTKIIHMPWAWEWVRTSYLCVCYPRTGTELRYDSTGYTYWVHQTYKTSKSLSIDMEAARALSKWSAVYPFWRGADADPQWSNATVTVEEREWRWRWFRWLKFPRKVERFIEVKFDKPIGSRKGGCFGCGYDLRKGETPKECLHRMQKERVFK